MKSVQNFYRFALAMMIVTIGVGAEESATLKKDYRLSERDLIRFQLYREPDLTRSQRIGEEGSISLPFIGTVVLQGKTLREAELYLQERFAKDGYFVNPQISLSIESYGERYVVVTGQVKTPGKVSLPLEANEISLIEALASVGGMNRTAKLDRIEVSRPKGRATESLIINLQDYMSGNPAAKTPDVMLQAGDVVVVRERAF